MTTLGMFSRLGFLVGGVSLCAIGCAGQAGEGAGDGSGAFSSDESTLLDFTFDGEVEGTGASNAAGQVRAQLLFTVGHLNAEPGVSQLAKVSLSNVTTSSLGGGRTRISYHAVLPVAWGDRSRLPSTYTFTLPRRIGGSADGTFVATYKASCADDPSAADAANYWYHYRPNMSGCALADGDVVRMTAQVSRDPKNTSGKYPEYARVWEDGILRIVAVFGKFTEGATDPSDPGITAYDEFVGSMQSILGGAVMTPSLDGAPGAEHPEVTFELARPDGTRVEATTILVDKLATAGSSFDRRYGELSTGADLVLYNGHAGLGANVRALADKGAFFPGKYQIFFFNGCDTLTYIDDTLAKKRAALNPDDPTGTRYMDILTNAMPTFFTSMPTASTQLVKAMLATSSPRTYESIFSGVDPSQIVTVQGEEDNSYQPSLAMLPSWGFSRTGAVRKAETVSFETDVLPAGSYVFSLLPDPAIAGGDADLRVRVGSAPTITPDFKCPSFVGNSNERCKLTLSAPAKVYVAVTGDSSAMASPFELRTFRP